MTLSPPVPLLPTHARDPFEGPRQIVVAMGQMMTASVPQA